MVGPQPHDAAAEEEEAPGLGGGGLGEALGASALGAGAFGAGAPGRTLDKVSGRGGSIRNRRAASASTLRIASSSAKRSRVISDSVSGGFMLRN